MACASCHPEGGDNGHIWPLEYYQGRRTMRVAGSLADRAPYHRDGSLQNLPTLLDNLSVHLGGNVGPGITQFAKGFEPV